jgi:plasmid replication initiation protein/DNA polymerase IIIc chi subunit
MAKTKQLQKSNPYLVVQDNEFINFRHTLTMQEARVFLSVVAQVEKDDEEFKIYKIDIDKFVEAVGLKRKDMHEELKKVSDQLTSKKFRREGEDGSFLITNYISSAEYKSGEGFVELTFDPKLKPYLLGLKTKFTQYDIRNILALRSIFSILLFQFLKQFEKIGERTFNLIDLKYKLNVDDKYKNYAHFRIYVLEIAQREIKENCDIYFEYEELKQGKRVTGIKFFIYAQTPPREQIKAIEETKQPKQPESPKVQDIDFEEVQEPQRPPQPQSITTPPPTAPNTPSMAMIQELGEKAVFTPEQVAEIVDYFDNDYVKTWEALKGYTNLKAQNHPIERPLAYIFKSKGLGLGLWESQQKKVKTAQDKQLKGLLENIQNEYRQRRKEQYLKLYNEATEEEKKTALTLINEEPNNTINGRNIAINQTTKELNNFGIEQAGEMFAESKRQGRNYRQGKYRNYIFDKHGIQINFDKNDEVIF